MLLAACGSATEPQPITDGGVVMDMGSDPDPIGVAEQAILQPIFDSSFDFAQRVASEDVVVQEAGTLMLVQTATAIQIGGDVGSVRSAATVEGRLVVATENGIFAEQSGAMADSPVDALLQGVDVKRLRTFGRQRELWLAAADRLLIWDDGTLSTVESPTLSNNDCQLAFGAYTGDGEAVWAACEGDLYGVAMETERAFPTVISNVVAIAVDQARTLWAVDASGHLHSRPRNRGWRQWDFEGISGVYGNHSRAELWVQGSNALYRFDGMEMHEVRGVSGSVIGLAPNAGVLVDSGSQLLRVLTEARVDFAGIDFDGLLEEPTTVTIHPVRPEGVASLVVRLDGATLPSTPSGDRWEVLLIPDDLADGVHTLEVEVVYDDGTNLVNRLRFSRFAGPPPTWSGDIEPLFLDQCVNCHGPLSGTGAARLHTYESWAEKIDEILYNLRAGLMPLGQPDPLPEAQIELVEGWKAAGFLVGDE